MIRKEFKHGAQEHDGQMTYQEFLAYFNRLGRFRAAEERAGRLSAHKHVTTIPKGGCQKFKPIVDIELKRSDNVTNPGIKVWVKYGFRAQA